MTIVMQSKTEEILTRHIKDETDCTVHWSTEFVSYTQDDEKVVSVVLDKTTGQEHKIEHALLLEQMVVIQELEKETQSSLMKVSRSQPSFSWPICLFMVRILKT